MKLKYVKQFKNSVHSDEPKLSEQPKFVNREHFVAETKNGRRPRFLL